MLTTIIALACFGPPTTSAYGDGTNTANVTVTGAGYPSGSKAIVNVVVKSWPNAPCSATVTFDGVTQSLPRVVASMQGAIRWRGYVAPGIASGVWRASATCTNSPTKEVEKGHSSGFPVPAGHRASRPSQLLLVASSVKGQPENHKQAVNADGGAGFSEKLALLQQRMKEDPYPLGQCTWWAWFKRPDLPLFIGTHPGTGDQARYWYRDAVAAGLAVGESPRVGAIAVFQPGQGPPRGQAGPDGHVAYILKVHGARMLISEANFEHTPPGHTRWVPWRHLKFIYGDPTPQSTRIPELPSPIPVASANPVTGELSVYRYFVYNTCANGRCGLNVRSAPVLTAPQVGSLGEGMTVEIVCQTVGDSVEGVDHSASVVWDQIASGGYVADYYVDTPGVDVFSPPIPQCAAPAPSPPPSPPNPVSTYSEQEGHLGVNTFTEPYNATGLGPAIETAQVVQVSCKVYAPQVQSANPDGYWYRIASSPWDNNYYSPANTFMNGDPWNGPYTHNTDFTVPNC